MPSSRPTTIPSVIHLVRQLKPRSILDVGIGFGKWGHLFREYTDILEAEGDPSRYERKNWQVRIDGIEGHAAYVTQMHRYLYNEIHLGDACELVKRLGRYDLIFMGDMIEHLDKQAGTQLLRDGWEHCEKAVIVTTPRYETGQTALCDNELERHRSLWTVKDFRKIPGATVKTVEGDMLLAVLGKPGLAELNFKSSTRSGLQSARRLRAAKDEIRRLIPAGEAFILIDDDKLRSELPEMGAIPFLEKNGQYWGPPPDDEIAIKELERLRQGGAKHLVIVWSSFWWLKYYAGFHSYLQERFRCTRRDEELVVFEL